MCPAGRITNIEGATNLDDCVSPEYNFYNGFAVSVFMVPFAYEYVFASRYHRVAFLRHERIVKRLLKGCRRIIGYIGEYVSRAEAERLRNYTNRVVKVIIFVLVATLLTTLATILIFAAHISTIFFKAMILWKGLNIDLPFARILTRAINELASLLYFSFLSNLFIPISLLLDLFANLKIDLAVVNVTCAGAAAPFNFLSTC